MKKIIMVFLLVISTITFSEIDIEVVEKNIVRTREEEADEYDEFDLRRDYSYYYSVSYPKIKLNNEYLYDVNNRIYKAIKNYLPTEINNYEDHFDTSSPYAYVGFVKKESDLGVYTISSSYVSAYSTFRTNGTNYYIDTETGELLELDGEILQKGAVEIIINDMKHKLLKILGYPKDYGLVSINIENYKTSDIDEELEGEINSIYFEDEFLVINYKFDDYRSNSFKYSKEAIKPFLTREFLSKHRDIFNEEKESLDDKSLEELSKIYEFKEEILSFHYKNLMSKLNEEEKKELKSSEIEWIKWKEKKFKDFKEENTEKDYLIFKILVTESRAEFLKNYKNNYFIEK